MAKKEIQIADKPTLDKIATSVEEVEKSVGNVAKILECTPYGDFYSGENENIGSISDDVSGVYYNGNGAVVYNDKIYIIGTGHSGGYAKYCPVWDGSSWTKIEHSNYYMMGGCSVVYNNKIHILGSTYEDNYTKHYSYDGSSWASVSTLPYNFGNGCAVVYNDEIHILGGGSNNTAHYKWDGSSWIYVSVLPFAFYDGCAVIYNDEIHILGGRGNNTAHYKWDGIEWINVYNLPYSFYDGYATVYNDEIHIIGGGASGATSAAKYHYTVRKSTYGRIKISLLKGQKIYSGVTNTLRLHAIKNCEKDTDHFVVTEDSVAEFGVEIPGETVILTIY